jgi:hypothetical protein
MVPQAVFDEQLAVQRRQSINTKRADLSKQASTCKEAPAEVPIQLLVGRLKRVRGEPSHLERSEEAQVFALGLYTLSASSETRPEQTRPTKAKQTTR